MTIELPDDVVEAAIRAAYPGGYEQHTANVEAAVEVVAHWFIRTYRLDDARHLIKVDGDGWTVQHPQTCRPNLFACPWGGADGYDRAALEQAEALGPWGVFVGVLTDHGDALPALELGDRVDP